MSWMIALDWVLLVAVVWSVLDDRVAKRELAVADEVEWQVDNVNQYRVSPRLRVDLTLRP